MSRQIMTRLIYCLVLLAPFATQAEEKHWYNYDHLYLQGGTYVHFESSDDHTGSNIFVALEARKANDWLYGLALFDNSFGQFSQYLYGGKSWWFHGKWEGFNAKLTAGLIHGYKGEFKDKIPLNGLGIAPAIVPTLGFQWKHLVVEGNLGGLAVFTVTAGIAF